VSKLDTNVRPGSETVRAAGASAPWITMLHGASQDRRLFRAQRPAFESDHRLLLVDLPGHGASRALPGPYGFEEHLAAVLVAMDEAGIDSTHLWGTHTGSAVGLLLAVRHPERVCSLILEGAVIPGGPPPAVVQETFDRARATALTEGMDAALREWFEQSAWFQVMREQPQRCRAEEHWAMVSEFQGGPWLDDPPARPVASISEQLPALRQPVLLINGEHDAVDFIHMADKLEAALPRVRRVVIPDAGGFPMWEYPERVNIRVREFLQRSL
jgi:3-oxoadipate enol-lactonase